MITLHNPQDIDPKMQQLHPKRQSLPPEGNLPAQQNRQRRLAEVAAAAPCCREQPPPEQKAMALKAEGGGIRLREVQRVAPPLCSSALVSGRPRHTVPELHSIVATGAATCAAYYAGNAKLFGPFHRTL